MFVCTAGRTGGLCRQVLMSVMLKSVFWSKKPIQQTKVKIYFWTVLYKPNQIPIWGYLILIFVHVTVSHGRILTVWSVVLVGDYLFLLWPNLLYMSLLCDCAWSGGAEMYWICKYGGIMCLYYRLTLICIWMSQMYHIALLSPFLHWVLWITASHYCDRWCIYL